MLSTAFLALLPLVASAIAAPAVTLTVTNPAGGAVDINNLNVVTTVKNTGDEALKLLKNPNTVVSDMPTNTFTLVNDAGAGPDFTGMLVKYSPANVVSTNDPDSFITLAPGESFDLTHKLGDAWDFTNVGAGDYTVQASQLIQYVTDNGDIEEFQVNHEPVQLKLQGALKTVGQVVSGAVPASRKRANFNSCSALQQGDLQAAIPLGSALAQDAFRASQQGRSDPRYTTWFGPYTSQNAQIVASHFNNIARSNFLSFTYDCSCTKNDVYAYVYPTQFGTIYLCGAFWRAPPTGTDSKAGTLVHETSHFNVMGGTRDYAYGQNNCKSLAQANPSQAIMNADSHEYYAENNPPLP